jgi:electron transport complex protein RnfB
MSTEVYERLAAALDRLPNGFPRTPAGTEIAILQRIAPEEEAALAAELSGTMETAEAIAARTGRDTREVKRLLIAGLDRS